MQEKQNKQTIRSKLTPLFFLRAVIIIFTGMMAGVCLYFINASIFSSGSMPMPFGVGAGVVLSGSMEPELNVDDVIIVRRETSYHVGDVVVFSRDGAGVVHRIVRVSGSDIVTKGDANNAEDDPIILSDISGRVVGSIPRAGAVVEFLRSPLGVLCILCLAVLLLELSFRSETRSGEHDIERLRAEINELKNREAANDQLEDDSKNN